MSTIPSVLYADIGISEHLLSELVQEFISYCLNIRKMSPDTVKTRRTHLKQFSLHFRYLEDLNVQRVDQYFFEYELTHKLTTANTGRRIVKVFIKWVKGYKEISTSYNPDLLFLVKEDDALPVYISDEVIKEVLSKTQTYQDKLMIALFRESGIRIGEFVKLKVSDLSSGSILVTGKGRKQRRVLVSHHLYKQLVHFADYNGRSGDDYLFQNLYNGYKRQMTIGTARRRLQMCFKRAVGIDVCPRQMRHSFAVGMLRNGADIVTIQQLMGHDDITTTMTYLRVDNSFVSSVYYQASPDSFLS